MGVRAISLIYMPLGTITAPTLAATRGQGRRQLESRIKSPCIGDQSYAVDAKVEYISSSWDAVSRPDLPNSCRPMVWWYD